jgi:hypothetical protein
VIFGAVFDVANEGVSPLRGDFVGAGLCLRAAVPEIGDYATAVKSGYKAAKTVTKANTGIRHGMMAYEAKSVGDGMKNEGAKEGDYVNAARDALPAIVMKVTTGKSFTKSRGIKSNVADLDGIQKEMKADLGGGKWQAKSGSVEVRSPKNATSEQIAQTKTYVDSSNRTKT